MRRIIAIEDVEAEVQHLHRLTPADLRARWQALTGKSPGPGLRGELLQRALAHITQESTLGGLSRDVKGRLNALVAEYRNKDAQGAAPKDNSQRRIKPGSRLIRSWKGVVHEVVVLEDGYSWNGVTYKALSSIARDITGTHWNGWNFFGLGGANPKSKRTFAGSQATSIREVGHKTTRRMQKTQPLSVSGTRHEAKAQSLTGSDHA